MILQNQSLSLVQYYEMQHFEILKNNKYRRTIRRPIAMGTRLITLHISNVGYYEQEDSFEG